MIIAAPDPARATGLYATLTGDASGEDGEKLLVRLENCEVCFPEPDAAMNRRLGVAGSGPFYIKLRGEGSETMEPDRDSLTEFEYGSNRLMAQRAPSYRFGPRVCPSDTGASRMSRRLVAE